MKWIPNFPWYLVFLDFAEISRRLACLWNMSTDEEKNVSFFGMKVLILFREMLQDEAEYVLIFLHRREVLLCTDSQDSSKSWAQKVLTH